MRLEVSYVVDHHPQCSSLGFGSFLCLLVVIYNTLTWRGNWDMPVSNELEDPWHSIFDDLREWLSGPRARNYLNILSIAAISIGTYAADNQDMRSTYICFTSLVGEARVMVLHAVGLALDGGILINIWRVLVWTRGFKPKLRLLSKILILASTAALVVWTVTYMSVANRHVDVEFGHSQGTDVLIDSFAFTVFAISATIWACEFTPMIPLVLITSIVGIGRSFSNVLSLGDWMHLSRSASLLPLYLIASGFTLFLFVNDVRYFMVLRRTLVLFSIFVLLLTCTTLTVVRPLSLFEERHPVNDLVYEARALHDRWLLRAATSTSIATAVTTYEERHGGRSPPPKFGEWYQLASGSAVIDEFEQIDKDLEIFWTMSPSTLRKRVELATSYTGVGSIIVKNGQVIASDLRNGTKDLDYAELINMVQKFSRHLPDMLIPVNLEHSPRVIPSWADKQLHSHAYLQSTTKRTPATSGNESFLITDALGRDTSSRPDKNQPWRRELASELRHMHQEACPPISPLKARFRMNVGSFCSACVKPHSRGQFLDKWVRSLETCNQPDLTYLHSFFLSDPVLPLVQELVPLFGSSKMDGFSDIVLPLSPSQADEPDREETFSERKDTLFWSTSVTAHAINEDALRGSHKTRLLHLINDPNAGDRVTMVLPLHESEESFKSESVLVTQANHDLSFNFGVGYNDSCSGRICDLVKQLYGKNNEGEDAMGYRYILLTDEDDGPPKSICKVLRSRSVPFISTIFQTWYSERLTPWLHFVPIDIRYQALHATLLYFTGTENRAKMNGIDMYLKGRPSDAEWIAQQGQRWTARALQKEDREIYLFRLLLEWGRLVDDRRDSIGYRKNLDGEYRSDDWSRPPSP
ncbi:hypothetical protein E4U52_006088 [Claviceps spartinae]|nr:hypothetical protein E4U52_006088 [Claviceps spartinae]